MAKSKFYAVRSGREGPRVYYSWEECAKAVLGWPGALHKSFATEKEAKAWVINFDHALGNAALGPQTRAALNPQTSPRTALLAGTLPTVSAHVEPFTEDSIPRPSSSDQVTSALKPTGSLSDEQEHILGLAKQGRNIFFTGSAGTGKSFLLREIIDHFGGCVSEGLAITASTGIAAVDIGGVTLHSWAGIDLGVGDVDTLLEKIERNTYSRKRWQRTRTLIIDEVSMVDGVLYDKLECIARGIRKNDMPFGGIQLVVSGDFFQLPPVPDRHGTPVCFVFESRSWGKCFESSNVGTVHRLTKVFRQRDQAFIDMLNSLRHGQPDARTSAQFQALSRPIHYSDGLEPCELFSLREQVREANESRLRRLTGELQTFVALDTTGQDMYCRPVSMDKAKTLLDKLIAPATIELKVGAQVMLIKNIVQGRLVNGSIGQVVGFLSLKEAQNLDTEIAEVDKLGSERQRRTRDDDPATADKVWPVVQFMNGRTLLLTPVEFEVVNVLGSMEACRIQVPLILSWALSIHKSQGQTIERVKVDLGQVFEKGQAYVALSRATCLEGLQVLNFNPSVVMAHPKVLRYYEQLDANKASPAVRTVADPDD